MRYIAKSRPKAYSDITIITNYQLFITHYPLPAAAVLIFFTGAAGAGIVSADFRRGAYYLDIFRLAAGTHRGAALMEGTHGAVVCGALRDAAAMSARSGFFGTNPYQYQ